ncbi:6-hydroxynicotinate 3-monooxygenase [Cupriavidus yeoncheonensis]|uniref:6-hydroxynicotinate 3-monooxygenase n=1 Tax=Cupriavidus yeoncheonensis TaxID=1462994 RepID=A0A916IWH7_9BURK|nr:FAD-dependent monooxygenase [Cupriavidus yeoncheonensis]CAG2141410.1 6-hydroxynicotinate 3-monooxygenase [Cupriavidus yeoncheonensis]
MTSLKIGINGAGIGGLAAAIALRKLGMDVTVYEQASRFARVGADINLTPNAVRALDGLGVGDALRETAARPTHRISRTWDTGEETSRLPMSDEAEQRYGAPQLTMHRADLMSALESALPAAKVRLGHKAVAIERNGGGITVRFADGSEDEVDVLVGADGIHSMVRTALFGQESPIFTGVVAYRAVVPAERLAGVPNLDAFTKWWGTDPASQIVTFPLNRGRDIFIFATVAQASWRHESWTTPGRVEDLRSAYAGFHPEARVLLDACDDVLISALYVRDPLPSWSDGHVTLMGDACHPMMPFMAQGAGMAIEDGVVLARCLAEAAGDGQAAVPAALACYQRARHERTSRIQIGSRSNAWLKEGGNADWVYDYDAWNVALG